jgi:hypothetical protein
MAGRGHGEHGGILFFVPSGDTDRTKDLSHDSGLNLKKYTTTPEFKGRPIGV